MKTAVFDARSILNKPSGIGVYARELALLLPGLLPNWRFVFLCCEPAVRARLEMEMPRAVRDRVSYRSLTYSFGSPTNQFFLPRVLRAEKADLFHAPNFFYPYFSFRRGGGGPIRCLATIHDVIPLLFKDFAPGSRTARLRGLFCASLKACAHRADALVTVSECSKRDIIRVLQLSDADAARVHAVWNGVDAAFGARPHASFQRASTEPRTLLYVGRMDPYKNVSALVQAVHDARSLTSVPLRLVIVGPLDERYPEAQRLAEQLGETASGGIQFLGAVSFSKLLELYRTSDLLVHPAKYEGFGLQLAEAMCAGLPVLCTDGGSAPEVVGDAARIAPLSQGVAGLAQAIAELCGDSAQLERMSAAGLARGPRFTWERAAREIAALYEP